MGWVFLNKLKELRVTQTPITTPTSSSHETALEFNVDLYFSTQDAEHLSIEKRSIKCEKKYLPKKIVDELKIGPISDKLMPVFGDNVKIRQIYISGDTAFVDFDKTILDKSMGTTGELLTIYAITNSLCFNLNVKKVKFLIGGDEVKTLGHLDLSNVFYPNNDIISK